VFVLRLLSVVVKFGFVVVVVVGGVYVYENWESWDTADSGSGPAPIDYNCGLPGCGSPWLWEQNDTCNDDGRAMWDPSAPGPFPVHRIIRCTPNTVIPWPGWFWAKPYWGPGIGPELYVPVDDRNQWGATRNWGEVYAALCAVHPQLGGNGLTPMSADDRDAYGVKGNDWYVGSGPAPNGKDNLYELPVLSEETLDILTGDGSGECGSSQASAKPTPIRHHSPTPAPTPTPTPAPSGETRRYRITVNGYENALPWPVPVGPVRTGVRFDYRLIGEFALTRPTASKPWTVVSRRVVTADLKASSLYPADRCQVTLKCENRFCKRLHEASTLRLRVTVDGDEIVVSWGAFAPSVLAAGTCTDPSVVTGISYASDRFQERIGGERLPLQDQYVGPQRIQRYEGRSDIGTSFAYGLERLP
jgi:hypothetical protein